MPRHIKPSLSLQLLNRLAGAYRYRKRKAKKMNRWKNTKLISKIKRTVFGSAIAALVLVATSPGNAQAQSLLDRGRTGSNILATESGAMQTRSRLTRPLPQSQHAPTTNFNSYSYSQRPRAINSNHSYVNTSTAPELNSNLGHSFLTIFGGVIFLWLAVGTLSLLGRR